MGGKINLTRKHIHALRTIHAHLLRAREYIQSPHISICRKDRIATTSLHFTISTSGPAPYALYELNKEIGSNLTGMQTGIDLLEHILTAQEGK